MNPTEQADVLDALETIREELPTHHRVYCEHCAFIHERWLREEARMVGLAHEQRQKDHVTLIEPVVTRDGDHPELGLDQ